jgi:hypothetical protein
VRSASEPHGKHSKGQHVMARRVKSKASQPSQQRRDDLKDWLAIGMIVAASSFLVWAPLLI